MTTASQPAANQPAPTPTPARGMVVNVSLVRAIVSILETVGFIFAGVLALMNNGSDFHNALVATILSFIAHGVNHNAGGSPI